MDFSNYKIHIPVEKTAGTLLEPNEDFSPLDKNLIHPYNKGIRILQEEKRGMYLTDKLMNDSSVVEYFNKLGIFAC